MSNAVTQAWQTRRDFVAARDAARTLIDWSLKYPDAGAAADINEILAILNTLEFVAEDGQRNLFDRIVTSQLG